jgi:iron-sulfur cluster repair protein YtfE (RIC family)
LETDSRSRSRLCRDYGFGSVGAVGRTSELTVNLTNDHRLIARNLDSLRARARHFEANSRSGDIIAFNRLEQTLDEHFRKEERLLYPLLNRSLGSSVCDKLRAEHSEIMTLARRSTKEALPLEESFSQLAHLLHAHMSTEENVLFWYLDIQQQS